MTTSHDPPLPRELPTDDPDDVLFSSLYGARVAELNRPKKLNSLNGSMARKILPRLREWEKSQMANVIIMSGAGTKAFCAGGDVAELAKQNTTIEGQHASSDYFALEYQLDHLIATYSKPYIAIMDGITMGGGVGLSVHAPFRIATERTVFAMPETSIGFFPDVGGSFFLSRLDGEVGTHLALTSERLHGVQALYAGIATHYMDSSVLTLLTTRLSELHFRDYADLPARLKLVNDTLAEFTSGLPSPNDVPEEAKHGNLSGNLRKAIDRCYASNTIEEILSALESESKSSSPTAMREWATSTLQTIQTRSPTSLKVTLRQLRLGRSWNIDETFVREHQIARRFMSHPDFVEGVTARLMKPRRDPTWNPATLDAVTDDDIASFFNLDHHARLQLFGPSPYRPGHATAEDTGPYLEYPHAHMALPSEKWIRSVVQGAAKTRRQIVEEALTEWSGKVGVREKVAEVLDRKTEVLAGKEGAQGVLIWPDRD
jgi:3-hydroxyisobutyryl-CoA hydrolase